MAGRKNTIESILARIDKTSAENGCWKYPLAPDKDGYSIMRLNGKTHFGHRLVYEIFIGKIPEGLQLDHLCRNRACVNPEHLEPVTGKENILRGISPFAINARKTHCAKGHELSPDNVRLTKKYRECRVCRRAEKLKYYYRRQAKEAVERQA